MQGRAVWEDQVSTMDERDEIALETQRMPAVPAEGDDIVVVPAGGPEDPANRRPLLTMAALVVALVIVAALALVARNHGSSTTAVRTTTPTTLATKPIVASGHPEPTVREKGTAATIPTTTAPTAPTVATQPTVANAPRQVVPSTVTTPTIPPAPKQYGASALTWSAPTSLTIASGATATLSVTAHNPTDGTVTLAHPLSCTPRLDHGEMCPEMTQLIGSGQSAGAQFTIDAHGIAAGHYTLSIEGVLSIPVTVS